MNETKKTALYIRVSTEAQAEEGYSIGAQTDRLTAFCHMKAIDDFTCFVDGGYSGSHLERPGMQQLIAAVCAGEIARVVVYKLDRLSRSQKDTLYLIEDVFLPHQVEFVSINENIDTGTPYGRAMVGILSAFAQLERENIFLRTRMGMLERVKRGLWPGGGRTPYGYDYDTSLGILVPNADAPKVPELFELFADGWSVQRLSAAYGFVYPNLVSQILRHEIYTGSIRYKGNLYTGKHEPLISTAIFDKVQQQRQERTTRPRTESIHLLSGLLVCGCCGAKMRYQKWGKAGMKLVCYSRDSSKPHLVQDPNCPNRGVMAEQVERVVVDDLKQLSISPSAGAPSSDNRSLLQKQHTRQEDKLRRLYELYATQGEPALLSLIERTRRERDRLHQALHQEIAAQNARKSVQKAHTELRRLGEGWPLLTPYDRQSVIRACVEKVVLTQDSMDIYYTLTPQHVMTAAM